MIVSYLVGKNERRAMNPLIGMIDEFYSASHFYDQSRRYIIWCNIRARYLFTKEPYAPGVRNRRHVAYQCKEAVTIRCCQNDRWPLQRLHFSGVS
jgi:hypothetical protein